MNLSQGDNAPSDPPTITMLQGKPKPEQQRTLLRYATGVLVAAVAILIRVALNPLFGAGLPYITFFAASLVAAWFAGTGPGLLTVAICGGASISQWLTLRHSYAAGDLTDLVGLALYLVLASGIAIVTGAERRASRQVKAVWERTRREIAERQQIEKQVSDSRELLRITLASIGDAVITTDQRGRITYLNAVAEAVTGWQHQEAVGLSLDAVFRVVNEQTGDPAENPATRALREGVVVGLANHSLLIRKDGTKRPIDDSAAPIQNERGQVAGCVLVFRDVTERRHLEEEIRKRLVASRQLAAIVESSHDAIISKSLEGIIQSWNTGATRLLGYTPEQAMGRHISFIIPADRIAEEDSIIARLKAGELVDHFDSVRVRSDGLPIHVSLTISPIRDEEGRVVGASKIMRDITEKKEAEWRIHELMAQLTEADRRKDEFLAMLGHELRNPLAAVRNAVAAAQLDDYRRPQALEIARRQADRLGHLIEDLLDVARITQGRIPLRKEHLDLTQVLERAVESTRSFTSEPDLHLSLSLVPEPIGVEGDPERLEQVFVNLLSNAAKYTDAGGKIEVVTAAHDGEAVVRIRDTGIGIAPEMLPHIWELFTQAERGLDRAEGGLGIGLTVARRLVELHGGRIEAHSQGLGKGAEFVVRLPIVEATQAATAALEAPVEPRRNVHAHLLVVEDNLDAAESLMMLLELRGHEVRVVHDGVAALNAVRVSLPDAMLVDIGLPGIDGYEVARRVRQDPDLKEVVLVALSGYGREEDKRQARAAGFDHYLVKPVHPDALDQLVAQLGKDGSGEGQTTSGNGGSLQP